MRAVGIFRQRVSAVPLATVLLVSSVAAPGQVGAADPSAVRGQAHLSQTLGGSPDDFELVYERTATVAGSADTIWAGKFVDRRTGSIHAVYGDPQRASVAGIELQTERVAASRAGKTPLEIKADDELRARVATTVDDGRTGAGRRLARRRHLDR